MAKNKHTNTNITYAKRLVSMIADNRNSDEEGVLISVTTFMQDTSSCIKARLLLLTTRPTAKALLRPVFLAVLIKLAALLVGRVFSSSAKCCMCQLYIT